MAENIVLLHAILNRLDTVMVMVCALCVLVILQIVAKVFIFGKVVKVMERCELLLNMVEIHAKITDSQKERTAEALDTMKAEAKNTAVKAETAVQQASKEVKAVVKEVAQEIPKKVVEEIQKVDPNGNTPVNHLTTPRSNTRPAPEG